MSEKDKLALVPKTPAAIEIAESGPKRVLSGMVTDALALTRKKHRSKFRIVWVDDEPLFLEIFQKLIRDWFEDVELLTFESGNHAWDELQRESPDILATDLARGTDSMDGWTMIPLLVEKKVKYPVIVVSGCSESASENDPEEYKAESAKFRKLLEYARRAIDITALTKPFNIEELRKILATKLEIPETQLQNLNKAASPLQKARQEWEDKTTPHPKEHFYENGEKQGDDQFRKYGQAIAILNWEGEYIEMTKMERLPASGRGAAIPLVEFLKKLADKYHVRISGHAKCYHPAPPVPEGPLLSQEELEVWYEKRGFQLYTQGKPAPTWVWYPDVPSIYLKQEALGKCPMCGSRVFETGIAYACEASQACKFRVHKTLLQQPVDREQMQKLLEIGKTDLLKGFVSEAGKLFSAYLVINKGKVVFEFPPSPQEI